MQLQPVARPSHPTTERPATRLASATPASRRWQVSAAVLLFSLALVARVTMVDRQGLWPDEAFSLAMATGHSLEHPAAGADPAQGDYVESRLALTPSAYRRYLEHDEPPAGPDRIFRALRLSDTSPPLYYLLLNAWTRGFGTGDGALRLFSVVWAAACFPLLWLLARRIGGRRAAVPTCLLFFAAPVSLYYSTEGRMYSLLWFLVLSTIWLTLQLSWRGFRTHLFALWVTAGAAGFLTHYFYGFVWAASIGWLVLRPGRLRRACVLAGAAVSVLAVLPWYSLLPQSLAAWRVTGGWLYMIPRDGRHEAFLKLPLSFFWHSAYEPGPAWVEWFTIVLLGVVAILLWRQFSWRLFSGHRRLVWLWMLASLIGPLALDLLRGTYLTHIPRYALAGMPALMLLVGLALSRLRSPIRAALVLLILAAWVPGMRDLFAHRYPGKPFREVAAIIDTRAEEGDVVIMHSIPSGLLNLVRYMKTETPIVSWVGQLQQRRVPDDLEAITAGHRRVILVRFHEVGEPVVEEPWLRANARLREDLRVPEARLWFFTPRRGDRFSYPAATAGQID
jgi:mannosyltransferase